jgi:transcriptional regulator with GAF, ATPase, and Fis domain
VRPAIDFDALGLSLLAPSGQAFERVGLVMEGQPSSPLTIPIAESSFLPRVRQGEVVIVRDTEHELDPQRRVDQGILCAGIKSFLLAPLIFGDEVGGGLLIAKQRPRWYDRDDAEIAKVVAASCVLAVQHQRLAEEQQRVAVAEATAQQLAQRVQSLRGALEERFGFDTIIGRSPAFLAAIGQAKKVAPTDTTVLLTGASGTGKEVLARAIHQGSTRAEGPFVAVNCAALPETLIESELFGHERGAFTGADRLKRGRFELASGGTLFLDEVGELAPAVQAKLLRILQDRRYERVGGTSTLTADVRLIAATNRNLEDAVAEQRFREDLFYRLAVFRVHLPSLRERGDDILLLADRFVREFGMRMGKGDVGLSREARDLLLAHRWPGNIRELQNAIERSVILSDGGLISAAQLGVAPIAASSAGRPAATQPAASSSAAEAPAHTLPELEKQAVVEALQRSKGNKSQAAAALGLSRTRFYTLLRRFGLE